MHSERVRGELLVPFALWVRLGELPCDNLVHSDGRRVYKWAASPDDPRQFQGGLRFPIFLALC